MTIRASHRGRHAALAAHERAQADEARVAAGLPSERTLREAVDAISPDLVPEWAAAVLRSVRKTFTDANGNRWCFNPFCEACHGSGSVIVGYSGREDDGNAPITENCDCFLPVDADPPNGPSPTLEEAYAEGRSDQHEDEKAALAEAAALRQAAADLSAAIAALPEGLEGYLETLDEPLSRLRGALAHRERTE